MNDLDVVTGAAARDVYLLDRQSGTLTCLTGAANERSDQPTISSDGTTVAFRSAASNLVPNDLNGVSDAFVMDVATTTVTRVSVNSAGVEGNFPANVVNPSGLSGNGRRVLFTSTATNLTSQPPVSQTLSLFAHDRTTGETVLVSAAADGAQADVSAVSGASISADGRVVVFPSLASNLVAGDTNALSDVFVKTLPSDTPSGAGVVAEPVDPETGTTPVIMTFDSITKAGDTALVVSDTGPALPAGFSLAGEPVFFDLSTTATFSGAVEVCFSYAGLVVGEESALRLLHYATGAWEDITTFVDTGNDRICGSTTSLSPFTLAVPASSGLTVTGFFAPIDMPQADVIVWNSAKAGQTVPVKWELTQGGAPVSDPASFGRLLSYEVGCADGVGSVDAALEEYAPGASGLQHGGDGRWQYNWKTPAGYSGTCRVMYVEFSDGSTSEGANFKFR